MAKVLLSYKIGVLSKSGAFPCTLVVAKTRLTWFGFCKKVDIYKQVIDIPVDDLGDTIKIFNCMIQDKSKF